MSKPERVYSVDGLRGLCATGIMIYHFTSWSKLGVGEPMHSALEKIGIYGVESFFVISGFSLMVAYRTQSFAAGRDWVRFYARRAWRILPLLFAVNLALVAIVTWSGTLPLRSAALNFAVAPIIADPSLAMATGAWSLGVELGFYLIFPLLAVLARRSRAAFAGVAAACVAGSILWTVLLLTPGRPLADQWRAYVAMPDHLAFFVAGMAIALVDSRALKKVAVLAPILVIVALVVGRVHDQIEIVTGLRRVVALALSAVLVAATASIRITRGRFSAPIIWLGDISFALYLLHPLVWDRIPIASPTAKMVVAYVATAICAHLSYRLFEQPLIKFEETRALALAICYVSPMDPIRSARDARGFVAGWRELFEGDTAWHREWELRSAEREARRSCTRCVYDEHTPGIRFDAAGVCNYCATHDGLAAASPTGTAGWARLKEIAAQIKTEGRKKEHDVIVGVSGGCDSSYMLHIAKELGLRPVAVHYDNTWGSDIAVGNIRKVLEKLSVELSTYVVDNEEYDDLYRSFLEAGVPDLDVPTDIGLATVINSACDKYKVRYIFEGHSFRTEGVSPLGWWYMDSRYIDSVQKQFGTQPIKSFPHLWLWKQLRWMLLRRLKKVRPLYFLDYHKEEAKKLLTDTYGWQWYGGHHLENRMTAFTLHYFQPRRFGIDQRANGFAALVRSGQLARAEAMALLREPPACDPELPELVKKRLGLSQERWLDLMTRPIHTYREFRTYKPTFERMRPFFYLMAKLELVPMSFYLKYTSKSEISAAAMRVHVVGNTCNNGLDLVRVLRTLGVDAHLFLTWSDQAHPQTRPESGDPELAGGYPPWIHEMQVPLARFRHRASLPQKVKDELTACDIIHTHGHYAVWIMDEGTPYVIQPFGNDFFILPFGPPGRSFTKLVDFVPDYRWIGFPRAIREAYRKASAIVLMNVDHLWERAYAALLPGRKLASIGLITDTEMFAPGDAGDQAPALVTAMRKDFELILFQPTRQIWTEAGRRENGDYSYGNDLFLRGLAAAVRGGASIGAILVDKGNTCTLASKALVHELGIERNVRWIGQMPRHQLIAYYRNVDLTIDAFYAGGFGSACLEAMACGCPVLMHFDEERNRAVFGEVAPLVNARTEADVTARLAEHASAAGRAKLRAVGVAARGFVERHHASATVGPRYAKLYRTVLGKDQFDFADPDVYLGLRSPLAPVKRRFG